MKIYEIDQAIEGLMSQVDEETGEILFDPEKLEELQMERDQKVENLGLFIKNASSDVKALRDEEKALADRRKVLEKRVERAKEYLEFVLKGEKFQTTRVVISYRTSTRVDVDEKFLAWAKKKAKNLLRIKEPEADKVAIGALLKSGEKVPHACLVSETSMTIK